MAALISTYTYSSIFSLLILNELWVIQFVSGQLDTSICTPNVNDTASALPIINSTYTSRVEWKIHEQEKWVYIEEYYDKPGNRAAVRMTGLYDPGKTVLFISDYNTDEYITIQDSTCQITKLSSQDTYALPFNKVNVTADQMVGVHKALMFGRTYKEKYMGTAMVRNITAYYWESCNYDNHTQQTVKINFYFSDASSGWASPSGSVMVPLRNTIHRKVGSGAHSFESHEQYDFLYFQEFIHDYSIFQVPSGIYCTGRKSKQPPPPIPSYFSFRAELVVPRFMSIGAYDEWYDYTRQLVRVDSRPMQGGVIVMPMVTRRDVHDFNAGVSYLLDLDTGKCDVVPISPDVFDSKLADPNHIAIKSPKAFFDFTTGRFIYSGQKTERSVTMDTWIGKRQDFPPGLNKTSYWEWYFSSNDWLISEFGPAIRQAPMRLKITVPALNTTIIYNIFDFSEAEPDIRDFDVSYCYDDKAIRHFQFTLSGDAYAISPRPRLFKYNTAMALARVMQVSYVRVQVIRTDFDSHRVYVVFRLFDPPKVKGDVKKPINNVNSDQAAAGLELVINRGTFTFQSTINKPVSGAQTYTYKGVKGSLVEVFIFPNGTTVDIRDLTTAAPSTTKSNVTPKPPRHRGSTSKGGPAPTLPVGVIGSSSAMPLTSSQVGWQGGSVAGIAIGMTLIGLILGAISTTMVSRLRSRSSDMKVQLTLDSFSQ